jgi:hypothetical protein
MSDIAELREKAKDAFYAWEDKCITEWGGYGEWGSGLSDEQRIIWCEGYVQAMLLKEELNTK